MAKVFSFCIYGGLEKYCRGLLKNIEIIQERFPDFLVYVYVGDNVPSDYLDQYRKSTNVKLIMTNENGANLMCYRYYPLDDDDVEIMFSRDCDSRVNERDEWAIRQFIASEKKVHIIHDHFWHKTKITGGLCGFKKGCLDRKIQDLYHTWLNANKQYANKYGADQTFLAEVVYDKFKISDILVHSDIVGHHGQNVINFPPELYDNFHFVGNVYNFVNDQEIPEFTYEDYNLPSHIQWLAGEDQWPLIIKTGHHLLNNQNIMFSKYSYRDRYNLLFNLFLAYYYTAQYEICLETLRNYEYTMVDNHLILSSNHLLGKLRKERGKKIISTFSPEREPKDDEIVICYGNLFDYKSLPSSNKIFRHPIFFSTIKHDEVEFADCWQAVDQIYIINLPERQDRYMEFLLELCHMEAPLDRVFHYKARKEDIIPNNKQCNIYWGATNNHYEVTKDFIDQGYNYCMIFEDDFTFVSHYERNKSLLKAFFQRANDEAFEFDVCLLSSSKQHEYRPADDLLNLSYQECTTTSGYILNKKTASQVLDCFKEGCDKMKETQDYTKYVCDRYWKKLQGRNKFFIFKDKLGYQRPCYSSITGQTNLNMD